MLVFYWWVQLPFFVFVLKSLFPGLYELFHNTLFCRILRYTMSQFLNPIITKLSKVLGSVSRDIVGFYSRGLSQGRKTGNKPEMTAAVHSVP